MEVLSEPLEATRKASCHTKGLQKIYMLLSYNWEINNRKNL